MKEIAPEARAIQSDAPKCKRTTSCLLVQKGYWWPPVLLLAGLTD